MLWNFLIQTDNVLGHGRPDIYHQTKRRSAKLWVLQFLEIKQRKVKRRRKFAEILEQVNCCCSDVGLEPIEISLVVPGLQKTTLLSTAFILRKVLGNSSLGRTQKSKANPYQKMIELTKKIPLLLLLLQLIDMTDVINMIDMINLIMTVIIRFPYLNTKQLMLLNSYVLGKNMLIWKLYLTT